MLFTHVMLLIHQLRITWLCHSYYNYLLSGNVTGKTSIFPMAVSMAVSISPHMYLLVVPLVQYVCIIWKSYWYIRYVSFYNITSTTRYFLSESVQPASVIGKTGMYHLAVVSVLSFCSVTYTTVTWFCHGYNRRVVSLARQAYISFSGAIVQLDV